MAQVYRPTRVETEPKTGKKTRTKSRTWHVRYYTPTGERLRVKGYRDKRATEALAPDTVWQPMTRFFPWEDWRQGRPAVIDGAIAPALRRWAGDEERLARIRLLFGLDGAPWNEERVLDRYELLYEAGLAPEAGRDRERARGREGAEPTALSPALGEPMLSDHRRILAKLFSGEFKTIEVLKLKDIVEALEGGIDAFETVANIVEQIAVKES